MIEKRYQNNLLYEELDDGKCSELFELKQKKFLHNIDTFYYSVKLANDFTKDSKDAACLAVREYFSDSANIRNNYEYCVPFTIPNNEIPLNLRPFRFAGYYDIDLECPEFFDIFIARTVPPGGSDGEKSVTPEIIVQLRSYLLWQYGVTKSFEYSYSVVEAFCSYFNLTIEEVKENRVDYCWHSNYLQNPEKFFRIDNFVKMQVSHYRRVRYDYQFKPNDEYEGDYVALGKRSDKCFVRIYLKSKEVVEQGYKPWFFKEWVLNGLICRYDYAIYEACFKKQDWNYVNMARLEYYLENGKNEEHKKKIRQIKDGILTMSDDALQKFADGLTPRVTLVMNVEFQTTRRVTKTYELLPRKDRSDKGVVRRIYDYIDNRPLITEYLTKSTLRLVERGTDSNKSRCEDCAFWKALRSCRFVDVKKAPKDLKLIRNYTRNMNKQLVKKRMLNAAVTYSLYENGINENSILDDAAQVLLSLNDNDILRMKFVKQERIKQLNKVLYEQPTDDRSIRNYEIIRTDTGELL